MATNLTLKGIPDDVYARLKETAEAHRRSLNNEAISVLESVLTPRKAAVSERIARARALRESLKQGAFKADDIDRFKRQGRR
jgi:plasmid stability protein